MPEVSVVIPTYDRAAVLSRAMDSVLEQTHGDLELVVVDDGSTDATEAVVDAYDDDRVRYVAHETNRGANVARNTGIEAAEGDYVAFLDSDDEWHPRKLEAQLDRIDDAGAVAAFCPCERELAGPGGTVQTLAADLLARADGETPHEGGSELADEILAGNVHPAAGSTLLVETALVREIGGFDEDLDRFQDPEIVLRIVEEGYLAYVDEPLAVRYDTGEPAAETIHEADREYLAKHAETVERAEARGYDVLGTHNFLLAKRYFAAGKPITGARLLGQARIDPRDVPGLLWAVATGGKRRLNRRVVGLVAALAILLLWRRRS